MGNSLWELCAANSLRAQGEGGAGDGGGQVKAFGDLPPDLLVDDLHQPALLGHQLVEHVEIQDLLGHDGDPVDGSSWRGGEKREHGEDGGQGGMEGGSSPLPAGNSGNLQPGSRPLRG